MHSPAGQPRQSQNELYRKSPSIWQSCSLWRCPMCCFRLRAQDCLEVEHNWVQCSSLQSRCQLVGCYYPSSKGSRPVVESAWAWDRVQRWHLQEVRRVVCCCSSCFCSFYLSLLKFHRSGALIYQIMPGKKRRLVRRLFQQSLLIKSEYTLNS